MKHLILALVFILLLQASYGQGPNFEWVTSFGLVGPVESSCIDLATGNRVYTGGHFSVSADFTPSNTASSNGMKDAYFHAVTQNYGSPIVGIAIGGPQNDQVRDIETDGAGNVYTVGGFMGTVDFDHGPGTLNVTALATSDCFVRKTNANGTLAWVKTLPGYGFDEAVSIALDANGDLLVAGYSNDSIDLDPGLGVQWSVSGQGGGIQDLFVLKLSGASGNLIWATSLESQADVRPDEIKLDGAGNIWLGGIFYGANDFDPGPGQTILANAGVSDVFLLKLDSGGNFLWAGKMGGTGSDFLYDMEISPGGKVYCTGTFQSAVDFDPGPGNYTLLSAGSNDLFVVGLASDGTYLWAHRVGGSANDQGRCITLDAQQNILLGGTFQGTVDLDPDFGVNNFSSSSGSEDFFITRLDSMGAYHWSYVIGGTGTDRVLDIAADNASGIYATGTFSSTYIDFLMGPGVYPQQNGGGSNAFILKVNGCAVNASSQTTSACNSYTWPANGATYTASGAYTTTLTNTNGCDSILTLNLTIHSPSTSSQTASACNSYTWPLTGATYTSSGTYTTTLTNANGCDSTVTLNLTINTLAASISATANTLTASPSGASYQWLDCNNAYAPINGATGQSFTPTSTGNYAVHVSQNGCTDTSACENVTLTHAQLNPSTFEIALYPNPSKGLFYLDMVQELLEGRATVFDITGNQIHQIHFHNSQQIQMDLRGQAAGIYFLHIQFENSSSTLKLIKN